MSLEKKLLWRLGEMIGRNLRRGFLGESALCEEEGGGIKKGKLYLVLASQFSDSGRIGERKGIPFRPQKESNSENLGQSPSE